MRLGIWLLFLLVLPCVSAAMLHGTIYTPDLQVANDVLVTLDSQPVQRLLSTDGTYAFEVPPGNYTLTATYPHGVGNATTTERVGIAQDGTFVFDLFLFPDIADERIGQQLDQDLADQPFNPQPFPWFQLFLLLLLLALGFSGIRVMRGKRGSKEGSDGREAREQGEELLVIIRREGGRITQKELRKRLPLSEAKVSLLVNELVARGRLEKLKKGRGNILVLKEHNT